MRVLDLIDDAVIVRDLHTEAIRYWNGGSARLYGWEEREVLHRRVESLLASEYPHPLGEIVAAVGVGGRWEGEVRQLSLIHI